METTALDLRGILAVLRRRLRVIALVVAVSLGLAGVALLALKPVFLATALVLVDPSPKNLLDPQLQERGAGSESPRVDGEVELVKSEIALARAAAELRLTEDPEFSPGVGVGDSLAALFRMGTPRAASAAEALSSVVDKLRDRVAVQRRGLTYLIAVTARSDRPQMAADIANAVSRAYISQQLQAKVDATLQAAAIIGDRLAQAGEVVTQAERSIGDYVEGNAAAIGDTAGPVAPANLPPDISPGLFGLQQGAEVARAHYQTLLTRQNDLATQAYLQVADSRLVAEATPATAPSFPSPRVVLLLAGLAGLILGIGLAFLMENFVGGFTSEGQVEAVLKSTVVSVVPRQRLPRRDDGETSIADLMVSSPLSTYAEAIRRVRIGLDQALRRSGRVAGEGAVVVVSSAAPDEGKTTIALSLARAYALSGISTLLIDCDLRKPGIHRQLGLQPSEGLLEYLRGSEDGVSLAAILTVDSASTARVIVGSRRSDIATDQLVAGQMFARLISAARQKFDVVILDTPPAGPVVDALYLAGIADAIAVVVKHSVTLQQEVKSAFSALDAARQPDVPVLVVLNQHAGSPARWHRYADYYGETTAGEVA